MREKKKRASDRERERRKSERASDRERRESEKASSLFIANQLMLQK